MSDEDKDIDVESDEEYTEDSYKSYENGNTQYMTQAEKRAHHNALERKRRDHIKDSFNNLRDAVPNLEGDKSSRAQILKSATEYIQFMTKKNSSVHSDIGDLKRQNTGLEQQIRGLERAKAAGNFATQSVNITIDESLAIQESESEDDEETSDTEYHGPSPSKKVKT